ncbi:MAG: hypothetical protein LBF19_07815 [Prevotellaceae bacterium]|jgi:hypothetical protein|nr:hypothetical protein [Prevotellaceae bacterium]
MHIANPIYDVVFKYMMEDNKVAKSLISAIIGEEILELEFLPQERTRKQIIEEATILTVYRLDFTAKIATPAGYKTVIIEMQKAKLLSDIMRFRRYLGAQYQNAENVYGEAKNKARQIYCIYFLNYGIDLPERPVLAVDYGVKDVTTGEELPANNEFISSLHHRSWIVQINQLKSYRRNDLEKLLSIFDQENRTKDHHILNVKEDEYPEEYRHIIRQLRAAMEDEDKREEMKLEDEVLEELRDKERQIDEKEKTIDRYKQVIDEKDRLIEKLLRENAALLQQKDK